MYISVCICETRGGDKITLSLAGSFRLCQKLISIYISLVGMIRYNSSYYITYDIANPWEYLIFTMFIQWSRLFCINNIFVVVYLKFKYL